MDFGGFFTALTGVGFGYFYFWRHKSTIRQLFFNLRLLLDEIHLMYCYELLQNPKYYDYFKQQLQFLPQTLHSDALHHGRTSAKSSLATMYRTYGKHMGLMAIAYFSLPLLLFLLTGTAGYFLAGAFIAVPVSVLYDLLLTGGRGNVLNNRLGTLLKHAYSNTGYRSAAEHRQSADTPPTPKPVHALQKTFEAYPMFKQAPPAPPPVKLSSAMVKTYAAPAIPQTPDNDEKPLTYPKQAKKIQGLKLTFKNMWWSSDALLCAIIIVYFWATDAQTIVDFLLLPFMYIVFLQVFFVPMWFVIRIARKLMR